MNAVTEQKKKTSQSGKRDMVAELLAQVQLLTEEVGALKTGAVTIKLKREPRRGQPRENTSYRVLAIPTKNFPPQAITCMRILAAASDPQNISEADAMRMLEENKPKFATRQDTWRIFTYYRAKLIEGNFIKMM